MNIFKKLTLGYCVFAFVLGFSQEEPCMIQQQRPVEKSIHSGYNIPAQIKVDRSYDVFATANFIYWQASQENMELGIVSDTSNSLDFFNGKIVQLPCSFEPGFQLGIGLDLGSDHWDTFLQYTWLRGSDHVSVSLDPSNANVTLHPAWQFATLLNPQYVSGQEKWQYYFNFLDWDLARRYYVGKKLSMRSFTGLRFSYVSQTVHAEYKNVTASQLRLWPNTDVMQEFNGWGLGPRLGTSVEWLLGYGIRAFGRGEADVLFTRYTNLHSSQQSLNPTIIPRSRYLVQEGNKDCLRAHVDLGLGLGWGIYFANRKYHFDVVSEYNFQVFFSQNMFRNFTNVETVSRSTCSNGDLYMQGLTLAFRFDF